MVTVPSVVGDLAPVVAGGAGLAVALFVVYRTYAARAGAGGHQAADSGDQRTADAGDQRAVAHHLRWAQYTVVPVAAVAGAALFVLAVGAYLRAATAIAGGLGRGPVVATAVGLWGTTVLAGVLGGVRGYAPLARREGADRSLVASARTAAAVAAAAAAVGAVVVLLVVAPLVAAAVVAVGRPAAAAVGPLAVVAVERTRPLPAPWGERVAGIADRLGVDLRGAHAVADDGEADVTLAGLVPGYRVLFVTDRALSALDGRALGALVARELTGARRRAAVRRVAVETVPVVLWLASFRVLAAGQALLVGGLLVAPYVVVLGLVGQRAEYAADDAAAAAVGRETVVAAIEREAAANDVRQRRDPVFDLLAGRPAPRQRVERLRTAGPPDPLGAPDEATGGADGG